MGSIGMSLTISHLKLGKRSVRTRNLKKNGDFRLYGEPFLIKRVLLDLFTVISRGKLDNSSDKVFFIFSNLIEVIIFKRRTLLETGELHYNVTYIGGEKVELNTKILRLYCWFSRIQRKNWIGFLIDYWILDGWPLPRWIVGSSLYFHWNHFHYI